MSFYYNDYELIYLIRDGSELALKVFYKKYLPYIWKTALKYYKNGDKVNDIVSIGLSTLFLSLEKYNPDFGASFYVFFEVCLNRAILKEIKKDYYKSTGFLSDSQITYNPNKEQRKRINDYSKVVCKDQIDVMIYEECILDTVSVKSFSIFHNTSQAKVRYRKDRIIMELKKILTNEGF